MGQTTLRRAARAAAVRAAATAGLIALLAALPAPAHPGHGSDFEVSGGVMLPTRGFPIVFGAVNACDPASPIQGVGGYSIELPKAAPGRPYTITTSTAGADFDVVWLAGPRGLSCVGTGYESRTSGTVPANTDWAFVVLFNGRLADFTFTVDLP